MRRFGALVTFGWGIAACASAPILPTPYQAFTNAEGAIPGGYIDRPLGPGEYIITFRGDQATLWEDALSYAHQRARDLCPAGYDTLAQQDVSVESHGAGRTTAVQLGYAIVVRNHAGAVTRFPRAQLQIRCKDSG
jgi:hypothetical protein